LKAIRNFLLRTAAIAQFTVRTASRLPSALKHPRRILADLFEIGVGTLPTVLIISIFIGTELSLQGYMAFREFGAQNMVGVFVGLAGVRELAPILATGMIIAKAGSSITTNLAVMQGTEQLDAMKVMAVDPVELLIAPKFIAAIIAIPTLTAIADFVSIGSAYVVAVYQLGIEPAYFMANIVDYVAPYDILVGLLMAGFMGVAIWVLSCYFGYTADPGPDGVGKATNTAIVTEILVSVFIALLVTAVAY
jgi:phospholipid/cholesterol/gamma-HCH transport system permease protein